MRCITLEATMGHLRVALVLCLFAVGALAMTDEMQELANMLHNQCQEETGVPEEQIVNARTGNWADDNRLKCYVKCLMEQTGTIEDDGTIDEEGVVGLLPDEHKAQGEKIVKSCGTVAGADVCETAWLTHKCYYEKAPTEYYLP